MSNPYTKKNPWMSLWLSGANRLAGKGRAAAQAAAMTEASKGVTAFWSGFLSSAGRRKKTRNRP